MDEPDRAVDSEAHDTETSPLLGAPSVESDFDLETMPAGNRRRFFHRPSHIIDPKLRRNFRWYVLQCLLATAALFVVLSIEDAVSKAVVIGAIGSTAFILFIMPQSVTSSPRHVLGGHLIALLIGSLVSIPGGDSIILFALEGSVAVGLSLFLMAATNTEHPPAAGTALGIVAHRFSLELAVFLVTSIIALVIIHRALRPWLRDLY